MLIQRKYVNKKIRDAIYGLGLFSCSYVVKMMPATPMLWSGHPVQLILALAVSITTCPTLSTLLQLSAYRSGSRHVLPRSLELRGGGEDAGGGAGDGKRSSVCQRECIWIGMGVL